MQTRCDEVAEALVLQGLHAVALHGGRSQSEREAALHDFRKGSTYILVLLLLIYYVVILKTTLQIGRTPQEQGSHDAGEYFCHPVLYFFDLSSSFTGCY